MGNETFCNKTSCTRDRGHVDAGCRHIGPIWIALPRHDLATRRVPVDRPNRHIPVYGNENRLIHSATMSDLDPSFSHGSLGGLRLLGLWLLFALICAGLGYSILNRYDPAAIHGTKDAADYARTIEHGPGGANHRAYRVVQPAVGKLIYRAVSGGIGPWSPVNFALLAAGAIFTAGAAVLLIEAAARTAAGPVVGLLAALLLLCNFWVPNNHLAGMVDSSEMFAGMLIVIALSRSRWWWLPFIAVLGTASKETFAVMGPAFAFGWWLAQRRAMPKAGRALIWVVAMTLVGPMTMTAVYYYVDGTITWPWQFATSHKSPLGPIDSLTAMLAEPGFWYGWIWLVPLAIARLRRLPRPWLCAAALSGAVAWALAIWHAAGGGGAARPMFNMMGPALALAAAMTLVDWCGGVRRDYKSGAQS